MGGHKGKLTYKQNLVIEDVDAKVKRGEQMDIPSSVEKFYNVKDRRMAHRITQELMTNATFTRVLTESLVHNIKSDIEVKPEIKRRKKEARKVEELSELNLKRRIDELKKELGKD